MGDLAARLAEALHHRQHDRGEGRPAGVRMPRSNSRRDRPSRVRPGLAGEIAALLQSTKTMRKISLFERARRSAISRGRERLADLGEEFEDVEPFSSAGAA